MSEPIVAISASLIPCVVVAGVPMRSPLVMKGGRGSSGTVFSFRLMPARSSASLCLLARQLRVERAQVDEHQMVVGAAATRAGARARPSERASASRVAHDLRRVLLELRLRGFVERDRLRRDHVVERATLQSREHRLVDGVGQLRRSTGCNRHGGHAASCAW